MPAGMNEREVFQHLQALSDATGWLDAITRLGPGSLSAQPNPPRSGSKTMPEKQLLELAQQASVRILAPRPHGSGGRRH